MSMLSPSICFDYLTGQTERENILILFLGTTRMHRISHDHRDDHRLKMSRPSDWPRVGCTQCHQACDGRTNCLRLASVHHSRARDAEMILFQSELVITMSVTFCKTDHSKKKRDIVTDQAMVANMSWACIGPTNRSEYHLWLSQLSTWRWYGFCFSQIFYDIDSDILQHWLAHLLLECPGRCIEKHGKM